MSFRKAPGAADERTLSSLSTADEMVRILSWGTPQTAKTPSRILRWLICPND